ncbi:MAG: chemotaxis-specific protein-glutamate methyltransferase CheB [Planctomycetes bacterium]|nr:chemotaxis-specific protein-glutamate methyltransferase CheB [Planctomycetota bacterium]
MIKILITDDSMTVATILKAIFENEPDMQVVGYAKDGRQAVDMSRELKPDIITMDIRMPVMDGLMATRMIMENNPTPIVVISSDINDELQICFRAIEEGALAVIEKPHAMNTKDFDPLRRKLIQTIRAMSEVKMVRRIARKNKGPFEIQKIHSKFQDTAYELIAIGCSTGGPQALNCIFSSISAEISVPVAVVQHMSQGFIKGLVEWLQRVTSLTVKIAEDGEMLLPSTVYFAPEDKHLLFQRKGNNLHAVFSDEPPIGQFRPSVTATFRSAAGVCGKNAIGILLSGMGNDGAAGMLDMRKAGAHTIIQDQNSCVVFGMPREALALDAVDKIMEPEDIAFYLESITKNTWSKLNVASK